MRVLKGLVIAAAAMMAALCASGQPAFARTQLTYTNLMSGTYPATINMSAYAPDTGASSPTNTFQGTLTLSGTVSTSLVTRNNAYVSAAQWSTAQTLPADFNFKFVQSGGALIPEKRGANASSHGWWEFIVEPGQVWNEASDNGYSRAAIPFALVQKNANCTHNGVMTFLFRDDGSMSKVAFQITSETCNYLKFDMWAMLSTRSYAPATVANAATLISSYTTEVANRLPVYPISQLATDYTRTDGTAVVPANFAIGGAAHRTVYGLVIDGKNYRSACSTRNGDYPYCDVLVLPSYSTAKTIVGATALMRLEQLYPNTRTTILRNYVSQCQNSIWSTETFENAIDMTTGNYVSAAYMTDEGGTAMANFFNATTHAARINVVCNSFPQKVTPDTTWVYHSSDTYALGAAMNTYLKAQPGRSTQDIYTQILYNDLWAPLNLSGDMAYTRRTYDTTAQPFTAYGLFYHHDDIARIATFLNDADGILGGAQVLNKAMLDAALQRTPADPGKTLPAPYTYLRYNNGLWASNVGPSLGCAGAKYLPFMSGFGGISVLLIPNHTVYYSFMDDGTTDWTTAAVESNRIRNYCS